MHERQVSAGDSVEVQKKTVWYGVGKAVEKGASALGPESWRKRILHSIDTLIIPRFNPKWQEWAKNHREEIKHVALHAGVGITVVEITLGSAFLVWGGKRFIKLLEQSRVNKKLEKRWGKYHPSSLVDAVTWAKIPPSELSFFQAQIFDKFSKKFGVSTARNVSDTMTTLVSYKDIFTQRNRWNKIVSLANAGKVSTALLLLENIFQEGFMAAGNKHGWGNEIPKEYKKDYARKFLLPLWLETPQVEELASSREQKRKHPTNDVMDAFARIRDHMQTQPASREGIVTDSLPSSLVNEATLGQHQSVSPQWMEEFQQILAGIPEGKSLKNFPKEPYFTITYDREYQDVLLSDRSNPVRFKKPKTVWGRILRVLKGKKYPQQIREPFLRTADIDVVKPHISEINDRNFVYSSAKPADDEDKVLKPEKKFVEPVRVTKQKTRAIEKSAKRI